MKTFSARRLDLYSQAAQLQAPTAAELPEQRQESDRAHLFSYAAGAWLPLAQAFVSGCVAGLAAGIGAALLELPAPTAWRLGLVVGLLTAVIMWAALLWRWLALTRPYPLEQLTRIDIDGDNRIGPPPTIRIQLDDQANRQTKFIELPGSLEALHQLARGLLAGVPFSEGQWSGKGAPFSRAEFRAIRGELLARGLLMQANEKDTRQGYTLTPAGRAVMRHFTNPPTPGDYEQ